MSLMQEYEDIRNFLGHKKYDAMCKYIEIFGNYKEYDKEKSHSANFTDTFSYRAIYNRI